MYYLTRLVEFEASHRYWNPAFSDEENRRTFGKCVSPYGHGHNYVLRVTLGGQVEPDTGMVMNIKELDRILKEVSGEFDHTFINLDHPAFLDALKIVIGNIHVNQVDPPLPAFGREGEDQRRVRILRLERHRAPGLHD